MNYKIKAEVEGGITTETEEYGLGAMVGEGKLVSRTYGYVMSNKKLEEEPKITIKMDEIPEELKENIKTKILEEYFPTYQDRSEVN